MENCSGCGRRTITRLGLRAHEGRCPLAQDFAARFADSAASTLAGQALQHMGSMAKDLVKRGTLSEGEVDSLAEASDAFFATLHAAESGRYQNELREWADAQAERDEEQAWLGEQDGGHAPGVTASA